MLKKFKHVLLGFILGASVMCFVPGFAANNQVTAVINSIKIKIDGKVVNTDDKPITLNNRTYLPVRPIAENLGASVEFDAKTNTVEIKSKGYSVTKAPKSTPDGITNITEHQGEYYINFIYVRNKISEKGYTLEKNISTQKWFIKKDDIIILDNINMSSPTGYSCVTYDYYVNTILPLIK